MYNYLVNMQRCNIITTFPDHPSAAPGSHPGGTGSNSGLPVGLPTAVCVPCTYYNPQPPGTPYLVDSSSATAWIPFTILLLNF